MAVWGLVLGGAVGLVLGGPLGALAGAVVGGAVDGLRQVVLPSASDRAQVAFTIAAIALAGKMAAADGHASAREFEAFQRLFHVPEDERANAERFYRLAQRSPSGFEAYARQAADLLGPGSPVLEDLLDALLRIATVDGVDEAEVAFVEKVAGIFGFAAADWERIRARHLGQSDDSPWAVLGVEPGASHDEIKAAWRRLVKAHHPDRHLADGVPPEFIRVAEDRMAAINAAYARLSSG
ncbi:MAG: TerB family tellurite resistance protein [Thermaurantiacus sp.]